MELDLKSIIKSGTPNIEVFVKRGDPESVMNEYLIQINQLFHLYELDRSLQVTGYLDLVHDEGRPINFQYEGENVTFAIGWVIQEYLDGKNDKRLQICDYTEVYASVNESFKKGAELLKMIIEEYGIKGHEEVIIGPNMSIQLGLCYGQYRDLSRDDLIGILLKTDDGIVAMGTLGTTDHLLVNESDDIFHLNDDFMLSGTEIEFLNRYGITFRYWVQGKKFLCANEGKYGVKPEELQEFVHYCDHSETGNSYFDQAIR